MNIIYTVIYLVPSKLLQGLQVVTHTPIFIIYPPTPKDVILHDCWYYITTELGIVGLQLVMSNLPKRFFHVSLFSFGDYTRLTLITNIQIFILNALFMFGVCAHTNLKNLGWLSTQLARINLIVRYLVRHSCSANFSNVVF